MEGDGFNVALTSGAAVAATMLRPFGYSALTGLCVSCPLVIHIAISFINSEGVYDRIVPDISGDG